MSTDGPSASADTYTHGHHESVLRAHNWRTVENSAAYLVPHLRSGTRLLDVGCGPGTITCDLARLVGPGEVVAIEPDQSILDIAEATRVEWGADNVTLEIGDVYSLDYDDDSFDVVHAHQVLQHLSDPVRALVEMRRVCRPGGVIGVRDADYGGMSWAPADPRLDHWRDVYRRVAQKNDAEPDGARHLIRWAREAGFTDVTVSAYAWVFATPELRAFWGSLWATRVVKSSLGEQAIAYGLATAEDLQDIAAAFDAWAADPDGWFIVPNGELILKP